MTFIDWTGLKNPLYWNGEWSVKDVCVEYKDGIFYLFFSAFFHDRERERSHVACVKTLDWKTFSAPLFMLDGNDGGWTGMCSPNITKIDNPRTGTKYYLTFNSWGERHPNGKLNSLFCIESSDLETWSKPFPIAPKIHPKHAKIDIALEYANKNYYIVWKESKPKFKNPWSILKRKVTPKKNRLALRKASRINVIAKCSDPHEQIYLLGIEGEMKFFMKSGKESGKIQENYQFLHIDGKWYLLSSDYPPKVVTLYEMEGDGSEDGHWQRWVNGCDLDIPTESFNTNHIANAPFIADWRQYDGYFYILYAGRTHQKSHAGRGDNKLALARSKDLVQWDIPPN